MILQDGERCQDERRTGREAAGSVRSIAWGWPSSDFHLRISSFPGPSTAHHTANRSESDATASTTNKSVPARLRHGSWKASQP